MLLAALLFWFQDDAKLALSLAPPPAAVKSGETIAVGVYLRNTGGKPLDLVAPARIQARIASNASVQPVELVRRGPTPATHALAPGETIFAEYALTLPPRMNGRVVLNLERLSAAPVVLDIADEGGHPQGSKSLPPAPPASGVQNEAESAPSRPPSASPSAAQPQSELPTQAGAQSARLPAEPPMPISEHTWQRFSVHEPTYFVGGDRPSARFQFSFKYQFIDPESPFGSRHPWISSLRFGYTQTSLWDIAGSSQPFTDSSYRPELFVSRDRLEGIHIPFVEQVGLEAGLQHESNGRDGDDSRGYNSIYVRPIFFFGKKDGFNWRVMPKIFTYVGGNSGNSDLSDYRGYVDLRIVAGEHDGLEVSALGRLGKGSDRGSLQLDATYPLRALGQGTFDLYLQGQFFTGYGESLLTYNEYTQSLRFGIALSR